MKLNFTLLVFFYTLHTVSAQEAKTISGNIMVKDGTAGNVHVINMSTQKATVTNDKGMFTIEASVDDLLVFSADHLHYMRKMVSDQDLSAAILLVEMTSKTYLLDEVEVIDYSNLNSENLGITNGVKSFTTAERRLQTAGDFKPIHLLRLLGGSLEVDPILNAINGSTARLKKEIDIEQKEMYLVKLDGLMESSYYTDNLHIPANYIRGFQYYLIEIPEFVSLLDQNNEIRLSFLMTQLAIQYNTLVNDEK